MAPEVLTAGASERDLGNKLTVLIGARAIISTLLLGGAIAVQWAAPDTFVVDPFFFLIALTFALTIAFAATRHLANGRRWLVDLQLTSDVLLVSAFIVLTGGINSVFSVLYALPIVAASVIRHRRGGLQVAAFSTIVYGGVVLAQYSGWSGRWLETDPHLLPTRSLAEYIVALNVSGFLGIAYLTGSLAEHARLARASLHQASREIAGLQALNQDVIDSLPSGLLTTDPAQRVVSFNHKAESICGVSFAQVAGRQAADVLQLTPPLVELLNAGLEKGGGARRLEFRYRRPDSREIDMGLSATHVETPDGRAGFLITFQDLTDIKRLEHEARMQQRLAAVGEMAAGIAHEIRNPLASISGSIQILRQELPLSAEQDQLMDIVLRESERLNATIRSFLAYARPQRFAITRFDARRAINDTALLLRNSAELQGGHVIEVADQPHEVWCEADEGQIKQIVWNLATNGLRAMPDGGCLRLSICHDADETVVISVQDHGIGFPPDQVDGMFQPFQGSFARGSGLGLSIVHRIVTDYGGHIQVHSQRGEGTTMVVRLPTRAEVVK